MFMENKKVLKFENGSWASTCAKQMRAALEEMKQMQILDTTVTLKSTLKEDSAAALEALRESILASLGQ